MGDTQTTDAELMLAYARGDQQAFACLYERHRGSLYRYFRRQLAADQADDCFQALWLKVIDHAPRYRASGPFTHYVFTLAHNILMDHYRKAVRYRDADPDDTAAQPDLVDGAAGPEQQATDDELGRLLHALLARLPFHQREAWILKQEAAMSTTDIASITRTSVEGVRSRLRYATDKLKAGLARHV